MSSSEPSSVLDIRPDVNLNNNNNTNMVNVNVNVNTNQQQQLQQQQQQQQHHGIASNEFFKPILKRKVFYVMLCYVVYIYIYIYI